MNNDQFDHLISMIYISLLVDVFILKSKLEKAAIMVRMF